MSLGAAGGLIASSVRVAMKIVIGLGNPTKKYEKTRHNLGFDVLDRLAADYGGGSPRRSKFNAQVVEIHFAGEKMLLAWPQTFMNLSGQCAGSIVDFYKPTLEDLLVVCDDFHLPVGKVRMRPSGSPAGQKGLADILRRLGTQNIARLRIGVGPLPEGRNAADFVLSRFNRTEAETIQQVVPTAAKAVIRWAEEGVDVAMNEYN